MISIFAFIPCHNRRSRTIPTLREIKSQLGDQHKLEIHLLDDLSDDGTAHTVYQEIQGSHIHRLSGRHFWGGSLNYIVDYCKNVLSHNHHPQNTAILIANDDLVFQEKNALSKGLNLLMSTNYDVIAPVLIDFQEDGYTVRSVLQGQYYDAKRNEYRSCMKGEASNIAVTAATWFSLDAICQAELIPHGIPHYGSDYWLTHQLHEKGFQIGIHPDYKIGRYAATTRTSISRTKNWNYWASCCNPKSPDYLPATITFEERFNKQAYLSVRLLMLRLKFWIYKFLTRPKNSIAILEL
jgi:GT2 family glycosyltransferase